MSSDNRIAIVGIGCRFPGGVRDPASFWTRLCDGFDAITEIPSDRMDREHYFDPRPATPGRIMTRWGGFLDGLDQLDADFFGISPREAERLDPQQRLLLETAWEALEDAGHDVRRLDGSATGVFVGQWLSDFESRLFADPEAVDFYMTTGSGRYAASGRLSYVFGLRGPSLTLDTACSSSLAAVHFAVRSLRSGETDLALAGGVNVILQPHITIAYSQSRMMAPDGRCKFGDATGDGYVRSEGAGLVVLKRLDQALQDGDRIYAVIRGSAVNNDGRSSGSMGTPSRVGQEELLRTAYRDAGIAPGRVGYIEAHGTGTRAGDPVELGALANVLKEGRATEERAFVGSVKTNFGHTEGAAGVAGLIKATLALHHRSIPASLHFKTPNPMIPWAELPLDIPRARTDWPATSAPAVAGVSAFGIAGTNAHVVLESAPASLPRPTRTVGETNARPALLVISAKSPMALRALCERYAELLEGVNTPPLADLCWSAATRRTPLEHRAAFVGSDVAEMRDALRRYLAGEPAAAEGTATPDARSGAVPSKIVFVVPGQGAQYAGMAKTLLACEPVFRQAIERCDRAAGAYVDWSILDQLNATPGAPNYRLDSIEVIQPVLVALAIAYADLWRSVGVVPDAVVGHSMGEVGAAYLAGALDLDQAMRIICRRSALMARTSGRGAMALVELSMDEATARVATRADQLSVAVSNSPRSSVISGDPEAVKQVLAELEAEGVFCRLVKVDVASHSPQMEPVAAALRAELATLTPAATQVSMYSTVLARRVEGHELDAKYWGRNLREPVMFSRAIEGLLDEDATTFIELGPHPVLLPSIEQTARARDRGGPSGSGPDITTVACGQRDQPEAATLRAALGRLWTSGHPIDWRKALPDGGDTVALPLYPWQHERLWVDAAVPRGAGQAPLRPNARPDEESLGWLHRMHWTPRTTRAAAANPDVRDWLVVAPASASSDLAAATTSVTKALGTAGHRATATTVDELGVALDGLRSSLRPSIVVLVPPDGTTAAPSSSRPFLPLAVLQAVLKVGLRTPPRLWFVTTGAAAPVTARVSVESAALWGTARVVAEEHPEHWGGLIDLDPGVAPATQTDVLIDALLASDGEDQIALRGEQRYALRLGAATPSEATDPTATDFTWRTDAAYLITGGLGDIGLHVARAMAAAGARRLVLLGRTELPAREAWNQLSPGTQAFARVQAVRALEAMGVAVHVAAVDVADEARLRDFLERYAAEAWPPIRGVVHAAGSFSNQLGSAMTRACFDEVVGAKLRGAQYLDRLLPDLDLFVLFSSTGGFLAQPGQANYAAANAGLDALALDRRARKQAACSIAWGVWAGTGLVRGDAGERNVAEMARQGIGNFTPVQGTALFAWLLGRASANTVVLPIDWSVFRRARGGKDFPLFRDLPGGTSAEAGSTPHGEDIRSRLAAANFDERRRLLDSVVRQSVASVLKLAPGRLDPRKAMGAMGLNSLMAMELRNRLEAALGRSLSATLAWNYPTVAALVEHLAGPPPAQVSSEPPAPAATEAPSSSVAFAEIAQLSDEDAARALRGRRKRGSP